MRLGRDHQNIHHEHNTENNWEKPEQGQKATFPRIVKSRILIVYLRPGACVYMHLELGVLLEVVALRWKNSWLQDHRSYLMPVHLV